MFRSSRHRLFGRINSALPDGTFRDWRSGEPFLRRLHLGRARAPDSSRVCHLLFVCIASLSSASFSTRSRPLCKLASSYGGGLSDRPLAAVETYQKLTCHRMVDSDKSEEHEMCSHIRFARARVADIRRFASAVSS